MKRSSYISGYKKPPMPKYYAGLKLRYKPESGIIIELEKPWPYGWWLKGENPEEHNPKSGRYNPNVRSIEDLDKYYEPI